MRLRVSFVALLVALVAVAPALAGGRGDADVVVLGQSMKVRWLWSPQGSASSERQAGDSTRNQLPAVHENSSSETGVSPYDSHGHLEPKRAFEARVKNAGTRAITGVGWRYEYAYAEEGSAELRWRAESFASTVKLKPGGEAKLRGEIEGLGELEAVMRRGRDEGDLEPPAKERVTITVVTYADGTRWQSE